MDPGQLIKKSNVGKGINYFDRIGVAELSIETGTLKVGDEILIIGPTSGVIETTVKELRINEIKCDTASKGERCSLPVSQAVRRSDKVYKLVLRDSIS